ncbi:MAG: branched-chain amino acid ABC transporter permease [Bacillota bacterium]|nr:branched-chain amino acid ABC transporter permease [Bacillota bacterium]
MAIPPQHLSTPDVSTRPTISRALSLLGNVPLLGWLLGALAAVISEFLFGLPLALTLGLGRIPVLFGFEVMLKAPQHIPGTLVYLLLVYLLPAFAVALATAQATDELAGRLLRSPALSMVIHLALLYASIHLWCSLSDYRYLVARLALIAVMLTLSLNVVNGYMGEFSCSHPGFMALGAYTASVLTVLCFVEDDVFGAPLLPPALGPFLFPLALVAGGLVAALGALAVAIPSFRARGDYLGVITLAFTFVVKSLFENLEIVGGPRGFMNQPNWAGLPTIFLWTILCIAVISNFVRSTLGKALNAVRDGEMAAEAMTVDTRRTKIVAFLFAAFWAGVAGGLFAHVVSYINPATFGAQKLAEVLAMVYFGGLNSVVGSVAGGLGLTLFSEALRPLEVWKWVLIPVLLILVMVFRPTGLIAFRDFDIIKLLGPRRRREEGAGYVSPGR